MMSNYRTTPVRVAQLDLAEQWSALPREAFDFIFSLYWTEDVKKKMQKKSKEEEEGKNNATAQGCCRSEGREKLCFLYKV